MIRTIEPQCVYSAFTISALIDAPCNPIRTAVYVETDAPSGVAMFSVYTDDGSGNGNCLLSLPVAALLKLAAQHHASGERL